ncbi:MULTISPECIES: GtrA family protein [unclassified Sulfitobacter]|jgi:putative flippase GtrA|uniref:GtrA family protein n=1 Tax=unclassified Sulfitobacter TaxID=196795 RepID=UPI00159316E5|nr:GtrA family protein [Sulfitobacter sp. HGT1]MBQ0805492.1 GtrA family protein [Sulfitobacter sp.]
MQILQHKLIRFGIVGGGTALAYVLLYLTFLAADLPQVLANGLAFLLAVMLQYVGQAAFTFGRQLNDFGQILRFVVMVGLGFASSALITAVLPAMTGTPDWTAAAIVTVYLPVQNYIFMTLWVFASPFSKTEITS